MFVVVWVVVFAFGSCGPCFVIWGAPHVNYQCKLHAWLCWRAGVGIDWTFTAMSTDGGATEAVLLARIMAVVVSVGGMLVTALMLGIVSGTAFAASAPRESRPRDQQFKVMLAIDTPVACSTEACSQKAHQALGLFPTDCLALLTAWIACLF